MGNYQRNKYLCWTILICSESGNRNFNSPIILGMGRGGGRGHRACFSADPISVFVTDWVLFACIHLHTQQLHGVGFVSGLGGFKGHCSSWKWPCYSCSNQLYTGKCLSGFIALLKNTARMAKEKKYHTVKQAAKGIRHLFHFISLWMRCRGAKSQAPNK